MRSGPHHEELMLRAAELYYYEGRTQSVVAEMLGCTRWTVGRLLDDAREAGLVRITIEHPRARRHELEVELAGVFGLQAAHVVPAQHSERVTTDAVAAAAARLLASVRPVPRRVAAAWGRTVAGIAGHLPEGWARDLEVVQANGGPTLSPGSAAGNSLHRLAHTGRGTVHAMTAPTIVESVELAQMLRGEVSVARTLRAAEACRLVLYSPGSVDPESVLVKSRFLSREQVLALQQRGAVGDVLSHFIDADGRVVDEELDARTLSMGLPALRTGARVVAVSSGERKLAATRAVLGAGLCTTLVTDAHLAALLLGHEPDTTALAWPASADPAARQTETTDRAGQAR